MQDSRYEAWKCKVCQKHYVVPDLARGCELKHHDKAKERLMAKCIKCDHELYDSSCCFDDNCKCVCERTAP